MEDVSMELRNRKTEKAIKMNLLKAFGRRSALKPVILSHLWMVPQSRQYGQIRRYGELSFVDIRIRR